MEDLHQEDLSGSETDGSLTAFSDSESEPDVGYLRARRKRPVPPRGEVSAFSGSMQRFWLLFFLLLSALAVIVLCLYGDAKPVELDQVWISPSHSQQETANIDPRNSTQWNADEILPGLYMGDYKDGYNREILKKYRITHIISLALGMEPNFPEDFRYLIVRAQDEETQDLISYVDRLHEFIEEGRRAGGVFIHGRSEQSRALMVVASYLMREKAWNVFESLEYVQKIRPRLDLRVTFRDQLEAYQRARRNLADPSFQAYMTNYPNKAQLVLWPQPGTSQPVQYLSPTEDVKENYWKELWDTVSHYSLYAYDRYLRYYKGKSKGSSS